MDCDLCGRDLAGLPYTCKRCGQRFCAKHRLPEEHDCVQLKLEKAERELNRMDGDVEAWFKDEYRLSNVGDQRQKKTSGSGRTPDDPIVPEDRYRAANASEECSNCGTALFEHEAAGCPHCGEIYCGDHLAAHRRSCDERDRKRTDKKIHKKQKDRLEQAKNLEEKRKERFSRSDDKSNNRRNDRKTKYDKIDEERRTRYSSPDVNPDGSLSEANYEDDIQSIAPDENNSRISKGSGRLVRIVVIVFTFALLVYLAYLFVL